MPFACTIEGHQEAGMPGAFVVRRRGKVTDEACEMNVAGITEVRRPRALPGRRRGRMLRPMTGLSGWLGHKEVPRPALVRQEYPRPLVDGLDCLLAIWIAEAMLDSTFRDGQKEAP